MRRLRLHLALFLGCLSLTACATYQMDPLPMSHPAHPDAMAAPMPPPTRTLAYSPSDIPRLQAVQPPKPLPNQGQASGAAEEQKSQTVIGEGDVVSTMPNTGQVVLDHEEIKGFMEAMTMGYRVDSPDLLAGLKPGDRVRFTIDVRKRTITAIEPLR